MALRHPRALWMFNEMASTTWESILPSSIRKGPSNVHADSLPRLITLMQTTADDWDQITSILLNIPSISCNMLPPKQRFKHAHNHTHQTGDDTVPGNGMHLDESSSNKLFPKLPNPTPGDPCFVPNFFEKPVALQFNEILGVCIRHRLKTGALLPFGENDNGFLFHKVP